jgi:putative NADPH-quinone reductase
VTELDASLVIDSDQPIPGGRTVVIVGHPDLGRSRINAALLGGIEGVAGIEVRQLASLYPDGHIDVAAEQQALTSADHLVLQYPTYWYSTPALLKRWLDEVLTSPWAYGPGAPGALLGKTLRIVTSTGGVADAYHDGAFHGWEYDTILTPLKATARRLGMRWLDPIVLHGVREISDHRLGELAEVYRSVLLGAALPDTLLPENAVPATAAA